VLIAGSQDVLCEALLERLAVCAAELHLVWLRHRGRHLSNRQRMQLDLVAPMGEFDQRSVAPGALVRQTLGEGRRDDFRPQVAFR
jgi:hypothetical protein